MYIFDNQTKNLVEAEIVKGTTKNMPLKKDGWNFNWRSTIKRKNTTTYILRLKSNPSSIQGVLHLKKEGGMLIMDLVEIAPHNLGQENKRYKYVAKGFLTFESKTQLIGWYKERYYAKIAMGQKMYIEPIDGEKLIDEYLKRNKN